MQLIRMGIRPRTRTSYSSAQSKYINFCTTYGLTALPASETVTLLYIAYLYNQGLAGATVSAYISAIRSLQVMSGMDTPNLRSPRVNLALKAMVEHGKPPVQKAPINYNLLCKMLDIVYTIQDAYMWSALLSLSFFAGLRGSECVGNEVHTSVSQVQFQAQGQGQGSSGQVMLFSVSRSKTTAHGYTVPLGCSGTRVCSLCMMIKYLSSRFSQGNPVLQAPLFVYSNGLPVTKSHVNLLIKSLASKLGLDPAQYSFHSIRAGAASTAAQLGFQDWEIMKLGGWKSSTYRQYIRSLDSHVAGFAARLVTHTTG